MPWNEDDQQQVFEVVLNHEDQYSIWPADREIPRGWRAAGKQGKKEQCLAYIEEVWVDMRPLSLRKIMDREKSASSAGLD
jgi:MbtH protein